MPIFTARENFKEEFVVGHRTCKSCNRLVHDTNALVIRWTNKHGKPASFAVCDEECWQDLDHNFWLEQSAKRAKTPQRAYKILEAKIPVKQHQF